jgi:hypothetical protein
MIGRFSRQLNAVESGYAVPLTAGLTATPFGRFNAAHDWQTAFAESGANDFDLRVAGQTANADRSTLAAKLAGQCDLSKPGR